MSAASNPDQPAVDTYSVTLTDAQEGDNVVTIRIPEDRGHEVPILRFIRKGEGKVLSRDIRLTRRQASHLYGFDVRLKEEKSTSKAGADKAADKTSTPSSTSTLPTSPTSSSTTDKTPSKAEKE